MITNDPDAAWQAETRARVAAGGSWQRTPEELERAAHALRNARRAAAPAALACPYCQKHPPLEVFRRYELVTNTPLRFCPACCGFWAAGDSLIRGVADPNDAHPALLAGQAPRRCRACNGHLKPNGECTKCKRPLPLLACPACSIPMERVTRDKLTVDACPGCHGVWFDMGEIAAIYGISPPQGLAASTVDEHAMDDAPPAWLLALEVLLRLFLPL